MDILREYHFYFSVYSQSSALMSQPFYNSYSQKVSVVALHKVQKFDRIAFGRATDEIRYLKMCSTLNKWLVAVYHARVLQIYDHLTGA